MMKLMNWKKMMGAAALTAVSVFAVGGLVQADAATVTVHQGDTLAKIAATHGTTVQAIKYTNNMTGNMIQAGKTLNVPFAYKVTKGDTLWFIAKHYHTNVAAIKALNGLKSSKILPGQVLEIPVGKNGDVTTHATTVAPVVRAASVAPQTVRTAAAPVAAAPTAPAAPTVAGHTFNKEVNAVATGYGPGDIMWQFGGLTYTGTKIRPGVIAVDPSVIPLGSKVYITGYSSPLLPAGGFVATAEDIGGAIKGDRVDIYMNGTNAQINQFGMQNVKMYVLK